jgi:predicted TIM-barrel fold metal-dependent hydrolase
MKGATIVSRRQMLLALAVTGVAALNRRGVVALATSPQEQTSVDFRVPAGACDSHVHVFGDATRFPFSPDRPYTPPLAPVNELRRQLRRLHMDRVVIVSPAVYGTNNDCTLDAIRQLSPEARGVALLGEHTTDSELDRLSQGGICGIRLNFETVGVTDPTVAIDRFELASKLAARRGWHVQVNTRLSIITALADHVRRASVPVVFDHFAQAEASLGVEQPGFDALVQMLVSGTAYVKVSAAYRISKRPPDYPDVAPLARALIAANPKRVLWGSDWPHPDASRLQGRRPTDLRPPLPVDDGRMLNQLAIWAPDPEIRQAILVENPARLYKF